MDKENIVDEVVTSLKGALTSEQMEEIKEVMTNNSNASSYHANGSLVTTLFYVKPQVQITGGKVFNGNGGGIFGIGGGALFGDVYTDDLERLYRETVSFQINASAVYVNINFFNASSKLLGHFQSGAISITGGTGGGSGSWS